MTDADGRRVKSVDNAAAIPEALRELRGATVTELAEATGLSPGSVHTHLATLRDRRLVRKHGRTYGLGYQFLILGESVRNRSALYRHGREVADGLADDTGEAIHLVVEDDGFEVILYESFGQDAVGTEFYIQNREFVDRHLHYSATGKAILAHLPQERVADILDRRGFVERTEQTITDLETLLEELERIRERGYAVNDEEAVRGLRAIGVPVLDTNDAPIGAISLSAPTSRLREGTFAETVPERVMEAANIIEVNIRTDDLERDRFESE